MEELEKSSTQKIEMKKFQDTLVKALEKDGSIVDVLKVDSEGDEESNSLRLIVDPKQQKIVGINFEPEGDAEPGKQRVFRVEDLESEKGIVIHKSGKTDAVILRADLDDKKTSGTLIIKYLANGVTDRWEECKAGLKSHPMLGWTIYSLKTNEPIRNTKVITRKAGSETLGMYKVIGIKGFESICMDGVKDADPTLPENDIGNFIDEDDEEKAEQPEKNQSEEDPDFFLGGA